MIWLMRPGRGVMITTRSLMWIASSMSWVTITAVGRSSVHSRRISSCMAMRVKLSRAPRGSSSSSTSGSLTRVRARAVRCAMPPDSW